TQFSSVEQHHAASDDGEIVFELEVVEDGARRNDVLEQRAQIRNVPLSVAQLVDEPVLGLFRGNVKGLIEGAIRRVNAQTAVENQQRLANRVDDILRIRFDL